MTDWNSIEAEHSSGVYVQRGIALLRGRGAYVFDQNEKRYIDCIGGHGCTNLGHAHPAIREALYQQADRLVHCPGSFANDVRAQALERLSTHTGNRRTFLANSGAEAIEGSLKASRILTGRQKIVAFKRAFHGRTFGALSATWNPNYRKPFAPLVPEVEHGTFNNIEGLNELIDDKTAGVIVEIIQGEGGVHLATTPFLKALRDQCTEQGALLIFDEVQTGFGRTGRWFGFHHAREEEASIVPDILAMAKGIAGGVPMGAFSLSDHLDSLPPGSHGSTFGGSPLACAACLATLQTLEGGLIEEASRLGTLAMSFLNEHLGGHENVREIRGKGLMIGIELKQKVAPWLAALTQKGVLCLSAGTSVLRLLPPLVISEEEWMNALELIVETVPSFKSLSASSA